MKQIHSCHGGSFQLVALNWVMVSPALPQRGGPLAGGRRATPTAGCRRAMGGLHRAAGLTGRWETNMGLMKP